MKRSIGGRCILAMVGTLLQAGAGTAIAAQHPSVGGELVVRFEQGTELRTVEDVARAAGAEEVMVRYAPGHFVLRISTDSGSAQRVREALLQSPQVEAVAPNYLGEAGFVPNDDLYHDQWHLEQDTDVDVDASLAWDVSRGSSATMIAVLDSGIHLDHPEFAGRIAGNDAEMPDGVDNDGNGLIDDVSGWDFVGNYDVDDNDPTDEHGHGTWVSSVLAANADDGFGVAGIDHRSRILPIRILDANNRGTLADLIDGLYYAVDQGADVINLSLINYPRDAMLGDALDAATDAGSIIVACAGNSGDETADAYYPGAHPATLSIGSTDAVDRLAWFSARGSSVSFTAPGESILVADDSPPYEADSGRVVNGCSLATPIVSGVVSLMKAVNPGLSRIDAEAVLAETAVDLGVEGRDAEFGWGRIDAGKAVRAAAVVKNDPGDRLFGNGFEL